MRVVGGGTISGEGAAHRANEIRGISRTIYGVFTRVFRLDLEPAPGIKLQTIEAPDTLTVKTLSIGDASTITGLSIDTLRYYERIGLVPGVSRNAGGQRRFSTGDIARLRFIRRAQAMDFSLDEIGQLLTLREQTGDVRADVRALTERKLAAIEARIEQLSALRDELAQLVLACRSSERDCPIIGRMNDDCCGHKAEGEHA